MGGVSSEDRRAGLGGMDPASALSFDDLFLHHYGRAVRLAALLEGDPTRAEDAVCDALARVYEKTRRGDVDDVAAYLRRAVVNSVRGSWRRRRVERRHTAAQSVGLSTGAFESSVVERDAVWSALARLPAGQRRVLVLRYYEDLSEAEVARLLHVQVGTVKSQAAKGLAGLRTLLEVRDG
jgi:RNA polymerase sigma-70 factor (sigma-E family)